MTILACRKVCVQEAHCERVVLILFITSIDNKTEQSPKIQMSSVDRV